VFALDLQDCAEKACIIVDGDPTNVLECSQGVVVLLVGSSIIRIAYNK
jgi:hypothetical protein